MDAVLSRSSSSLDAANDTPEWLEYCLLLDDGDDSLDVRLVLDVVGNDGDEDDDGGGGVDDDDEGEDIVSTPEGVNGEKEDNLSKSDSWKLKRMTRWNVMAQHQTMSSLPVLS